MWLEFIDECGALFDEKFGEKRKVEHASADAAEDKSAVDDELPESILAELTQLVANPREILHLLQTTLEKQLDVPLLFQGEVATQQSKIVHIDLERHEFLLRQSWQDVEGPMLSAQRSEVNFSAPYHNSKVILSAHILGVTEWQGTPCYRVRIPHIMFSSEMRNFVRVHVAPSTQLKLQLFVKGKLFLQCKVLDICENGFRLRTDLQQAKQFTSMMQSMEKIHFTLYLPNLGHLQGKARLRCCVASNQPLQHELGWEIVQIDAIQVLRRFVWQYSAHQLSNA